MIIDFLENKKASSSLITLGLSSLASIALLAVRIAATSKITYIFFAWNLFLAWIPIAVSLLLPQIKNKYGAFILFLCWLAFFPNSPYIITDIVHFHPRGVPLWYDMILFLSFTWNGLVLGFFSLYNVQIFFDTQFGKIKSWLMVLAAILLCGFGIYLGRYERWNSWDMLTDPFDLLRSIFIKMIHPFRFKEVYGISLLFSGFLLCAYLTLFSFTKIQHGEKQ